MAIWKNSEGVIKNEVGVIRCPECPCGEQDRIDSCLCGTGIPAILYVYLGTGTSTPAAGYEVPIVITYRPGSLDWYGTGTVNGVYWTYRVYQPDIEVCEYSGQLTGSDASGFETSVSLVDCGPPFTANALHGPTLLPESWITE